MVMTALHVGNLLLGIVSTIALIRYGQRTFGLPWALGAILAMGWGATGYLVLDPSLPARLWSVTFREGARWIVRSFAITSAVAAVLCVVPWTSDKLSELSGLSLPWIAAFVSLGLVRNAVQMLNVFAFRLGDQRSNLGFQVVGRVSEVALVTTACVSGNAPLLLVAWLVFPCSQMALFFKERRRYLKLPLVERKEAARSSWFGATVGQALELIIPTLCFNLVSHQVFVAYRGVNAAVANSGLIPKYWFMIASRDGDGRSLVIITVAFAVLAGAAFQFLTEAVPLYLFAWALIPLCGVSAAVPAFSRWKQRSFEQGRVRDPYYAQAAGSAAEVVLLLVLSPFPDGVALFAKFGFLASFLWQLKKAPAAEAAGASQGGNRPGQAASRGKRDRGLSGGRIAPP
jgi:hypothetical protein